MCSKSSQKVRNETHKINKINICRHNTSNDCKHILQLHKIPPSVTCPICADFTPAIHNETAKLMVNSLLHSKISTSTWITHSQPDRHSSFTHTGSVLLDYTQFGIQIRQRTHTHTHTHSTVNNTLLVNLDD